MPACDLDRSVAFCFYNSEKNQTHSCPFFRGKYILAASIGVKAQARLRLAQNQGIAQGRNYQFRLQRLTEFPAHHPAAE